MTTTSTPTSAPEAFINQVWRVVRLGGVAALAATQAAPHVGTSISKAGIIAGAVAFVEVVYRQVVPTKDQTVLGTYLAAVKTLGASPVVATEVKTVEAKIPAPILSVAEQAISDAGHVAPTS